MIELWLGIAALTLAAVTFVVVPFIRYQTDETKLAASTDWFKNRQQELEQEFKAGLFSEQEYQQALTELKLTAKDELVLAKAEQGQTKEKLADRKLVMIAAVAMVLISVIFYAIKGHYSQVGQWQETMDKLPELSSKIVEQSDQQVTIQELVQFALGLRTKLAQKEDPVGWMLLGRVLMSMNDIDGGISAFEKSYAMNPRNPSNSLSYAQALQMKGEQWEIQRSLQLLQEVMSMQPQNDSAVILFGEGSMMLENYEVAKASFDIALQMLPESDPRYQAIQSRVAFLQQQLSAGSAVANELSLNIEVNLSDAVRSQLEKFNYLFVFAKSEQMPMPIAVKKLALTDFPVNVVLTDADLMLPDQSLANYESVNVFARLSVDEQAPSASGEWQGQVNAVSTRDQQVIQLVIDEETP